MVAVYKITNTINNKSYIGITGRPLKIRWGQHIHDRRHKILTAISYAIRKHGKENFTFESLIDKLDDETAALLEKKLIIYYGTLVPNGYNITVGGDRIFGHTLTEEAKLRISRGNKGRVHSAETRAKISASLKGTKHGPETRAKVAAAGRGRKHTEETKNKISMSKLGKPRPPHVKAALIASNKNRVVSVETRKKLSTVWKGRKQTPEHKANLRLSRERRQRLSGVV